ncbi:cutinase family protein [Cryptosporangium sp. NPDC051539]|uniref:cutinase family protein n=1 Tax=Cryptosporangium sp. NPDC051539 TaxID=3363962 RepID=UPI0037BB52D5
MLLVQFAVPARAAGPTATLSRTSGPAGMMVMVSGDGWPGDDTLINVIWDDGGGGPAASGRQDADGKISFAFAVPANESIGRHTVTITDLAHANYGFVDLSFTVTTGPATECPATFIGAHGLNEGSETSMGETVQSVWTEFNRAQDKELDIAPYPQTQVIRPSNVAEVPRFTQQLLTIEPAVNTAATAIADKIVYHALRCGSRARIVVAGYSLGAWAVDRALRLLKNTPDGKLALASVRGVLLLGDPAFPRHLCSTSSSSSCRKGVATLLGMGYRTTAEYLDNGVSTLRVRSVCLSYATSRDPVCGMLQNADLSSDANWATHGKYRESGATTQGGAFLAGLV